MNNVPLAWFIALANDFAEAKGGVQLCTAEFEQMLNSCGLAVERRLFSPDQSLGAKLRRRLRKKPFPEIIPAAFLARLHEAYDRKPPSVIFFNRVNLAPLALKLREKFADSKFVLLSHGLMIMDELHDEKNVNNSGWLGKILLEEKAQRKAFDLVFTLTEEECALEKWLGTPQTCWVPRTVEPSVLEWNPTGGRVGFVGTLDHPPNRQALVAVLNQLRNLKLPSDFQLHIVGRPADVGRSLADIYPFVRYLGALNDDDLRKEAATWCCFAHPLFAFARGCSTKLAVALAWQIPILATPPGVRGYKWSRGKLPLELTPEHFAKHLVSLSDPQLAAREREQVRTVAESIANTDTIIAEVVSALRSIGVV